MKKKIVRITALTLACNLVFNILFPTIAYALTGGPSQPEVQSFTPAGTSEMVDLFTGDFNYNIPLMDVGGYPINISYNSNVTMDQEASWTGLGWNINLGVINRNIRGIPDDFDGDPLSRSFYMKANETYGVSGSASFELFGLKAVGLKVGVGLSYNNYNGYGFDTNAQPSVTAGDPAKGTLTAGLGLSAGSESGVGISPNISFEKRTEDDAAKEYKTTTIGIGAPFNSRAGLRALTVSGGASRGDVKINNNGEKGYKRNLSLSANGGSNISFANPTYTPQISFPMTSVGLNFSATLGAALFGSHANAEVSGYFSTQYLSKKQETVPAYGYLYGQNAEKLVGSRVMLDFNREKDGSFSKNTPNLPLTNHSYDIYSVAGQGVGGTYRPFRSDLGMVYDPFVSTTGTSADLPALEFGGGNAVHLGTNFTVVVTDGSSGKWRSDNEAASYLKFQSRENDQLFEPAYFKQAGEKSAESDPAFFNGTGNFDPVRVDIGSAYKGNAKSRWIREKADNTTEAIELSDVRNTRKERQRRNQAISYLNAEEASYEGLEKTLKSYSTNGFSINEQGQYDDVSLEMERTSHPAHHISEMSVVRPDGARYIYGIPMYNYDQQEVSFAVNGGGNCATGLIGYSNKDDGPENDNGRDHFYDKTTTPPHATAYLLTAIISTDYVDITGNGPSDDDYGSYTKFNYNRLTNSYKWRVPFQHLTANYNAGLNSDAYDNKASYLYGEKELWYVHSIETKTHVAEFHLSPRADGYGVIDKNGGRGNVSMQKLDEIQLFSKADRKTKGNAAEPIKVIHLKYDYSLCPGVPNNINNGEGKLTLKEIYFTYGNSKKGRFSPYRFNYDSENPRYNLKGYDRWGNYKPNVAGTGSCNILEVTTADYPYVKQEKSLADRWSSAWHLTSIDLPSGGKIKVDFESDDYAFVQDRPAMQMFTITATGATAEASPVSSESPEAELIGANSSGNQNYEYLFFKLQKGLEGSRQEASDYVKKQYIRDILDQTMYFKFFVALDNGSLFDYVPGYAKIEDAGVAQLMVEGKYTHGYVKLKKVGVKARGGGEDANPISKAAWQFTRLYRPSIAYKNPDNPGDGSVIGIFEAMLSTATQILQFVEGFNQSLRNDNYGKKFIKDKSFVRLYSPSQMKLGGGSRVKRIALSDEWGSLSNNRDESNFAYGQVYDYTMASAEDPSRLISSGVAAYEPMMGGDENPFRQPIAFDVDKLLAPSDKYYLEEPFGEMFFPGPTVGYSKVTVRNLPHENVKRNATGVLVHEFYTAKDFPTITRQTSLKAANYNPNPLLKLLKIDVKEYMTASQGYVIELNDMHGKPKSQWVYAESQGEAISGMIYRYKTDPANPKRLNNSVTTITKNLHADGKRVRNENVGVDFDIITDMREQTTLTTASGMRGNLDAFLAAIFPATVAIVLPKFSQEEVRFRSAVTTKVIQRYGLIDEVEAYDLGASVATKNLLYDAETGEVLLTETQNQFDDPVYAFTYPAHWGYDGMGMAYKNVGLKMENVELSNISDAASYFVPGDELMVIQAGSVFKAWVTKTGANSLYLDDKDGNSVEGAVDLLKILRSGRRNQQSTAIGSVTSLKNPLVDSDGNGIADVLSFDQAEVLNAGAIEFTDEWKQFCNCDFDPESDYNPFAAAMKGNWRATRSFLYLTDRQHTRFNDNPDLRKDGTYRVFEPFWNPAASKGDWAADKERWTFTSEVTTYSPYGFELENRDALGRYSSAVYGYNNALPTGVANNSQYKETAFDGFEDYDFGECEEDHFSYKSYKDNITEEASHSGRRSIKVEAGESVNVRKVIQDCPEDEL